MPAPFKYYILAASKPKVNEVAGMVLRVSGQLITNWSLLLMPLMLTRRYEIGSPSLKEVGNQGAGAKGRVIMICRGKGRVIQVTSKGTRK